MMQMQEESRLVLAGRHSERFAGLVNTPVFRGSTVLHASLAAWEDKKKRRAADEHGASTYGRFGTPTHHALEEAVAEIEGGYRALLYPSGLSACATALTSLLAAGDHVLLTDSAYAPTRGFLTRVLGRFNVDVSVYDPTIGAGIEALMRPNTRVVYVESPGSETFEVQDVPAIAAVARRHGARVVMDNTWGTPLFFKPFAHGVDVSVQAATKYIVGHSDAMLGVLTCNQETWPLIKRTSQDMGMTAGPDDAYLALRGLRTMAVRLQQHWKGGVEVAQWLQARPEVEAVLHPALPGDPGHALWKRDFRGACGLFAVVLNPVSAGALEAFVDSLQLFGLGVSWGGYESLVIPFNPVGERSATQWPYHGQALRLHVGLEAPADLIADLEQGFAALARAESSNQQRRSA
ncbi:cystathionine beta-lyase [Verminephrobacter aporrectodeae subsp. tuberculatae]|nr:cystathionine beta-lyase [Verminephrobacter aporrectodeae subsp. tuberculatae]MCW5288550.1 cystathionine beta-lyase [Verminephrobacter aporrectodeae subsp. tuberculatae]MCW8197380.1 cystathionine beta-lyase [Verminephrobacter aporrectodeae subsp. tuberculatae]